MAEPISKRQRPGNENVSFDDIFDEDTLREINEYESDDCDTEVAYQNEV